MRTRGVQGTDLTVSQLCLGTGALGTQVKGQHADRLVGAFFEAGGRFLDTAHCYAFWVPDGLGASERELGACLRRLGIAGRVTVGTKGGHPDGGSGYQRPDRYLAPEVVARDLSESLERLGSSCVDVYYLHRDDPRVPVGEIVDVLAREVSARRIRFAGASNWSVARIEAANAYAAQHDLPPFVISQVQWSLAVPGWGPSADPTMRCVTPEDAAWYAASAMPVAAYTSTASGYFAGGSRGADLFAGPANAARRGRAGELASRRGCSATQVALAWLLHQQVDVIPVFSTTVPEHLDEALGAVTLALSPDEVRWLSG